MSKLEPFAWGLVSQNGGDEVVATPGIPYEAIDDASKHTHAETRK
jgi:hypothetical protein